MRGPPASDAHRVLGAATVVSRSWWKLAEAA
jgi:hypothetical protein